MSFNSFTLDSQIRKIASLGIVATTLCLSACGGSDVEVSTTFANPQNIEKGAAIYFEQQQVGEVSSVEQQADGQHVQLSIDDDFADAISSNAAVIVNGLKEGAPLEIYNHGSDEESRIEDGQSVKGLDSMFQLGAWMLGDAIQLGSGTVSEYVESFQQYLESEKFEQDKKVVQEQLGAAKVAAQQAMVQVETELAKAAKELTESEGAAAQALEQLGEELAPVVEQLAGEGSALLEQLQQFSEALKNSEQNDTKVGEQFLASLLATLEKLNQSIEQGVEQPNGQLDNAEVETAPVETAPVETETQ